MVVLIKLKQSFELCCKRSKFKITAVILNFWDGCFLTSERAFFECWCENRLRDVAYQESGHYLNVSPGNKSPYLLGSGL